MYHVITPSPKENTCCLNHNIIYPGNKAFVPFIITIYYVITFFYFVILYKMDNIDVVLNLHQSL